MPGDGDLHPVAVYLLADHLDSALAAGEDLTRLALEPHATPDELRVFIEAVRRMELAVLARVMQARARSRELPVVDETRMLADLFIGGSAILEDALHELMDATDVDFDGGDEPLRYLASRGFVTAEDGMASTYAGLKVTDTFLVAGRIELGPMLDMVAAFLDALADTYNLYEDDDVAAERNDAREGRPLEPRV